ncbi:hypothetical protein I4U23_014535 [Adineta vaga]|nr:hypothetical protein I4U23_014535 [Adineta vaga]
MHGFGSLFILIISSSIILQQFVDARRISNDAVRDELHRQFRRSLEGADKRRMRRDIECPSPYHVLTDDNRCVWSCSEGTTPDDNSNECICQSGLVETSTDQFGRRICKVACPGPYHVLTDDNRCVWSCSEGTTPDDNSNECICQSGLVETSTDQFGRRVCTTCPGPYHVLTDDNRCVWSCSEGTTPDDNSNECICQSGLVETSKDTFGRRICKGMSQNSRTHFSISAL